MAGLHPYGLALARRLHRGRRISIRQRLARLLRRHRRPLDVGRSHHRARPLTPSRRGRRAGRQRRRSVPGHGPDPARVLARTCRDNPCDGPTIVVDDWSRHPAASTASTCPRSGPDRRGRSWRVVVAWTESTVSQGSDVMTATSMDGAASFGPMVRASDDAGAANQSHPALGAGASVSGRVDLAFLDDRSGGPRRRPRHRWRPRTRAASRSGRRTWRCRAISSTRPPGSTPAPRRWAGASGSRCSSRAVLARRPYARGVDGDRPGERQPQPGHRRSDAAARHRRAKRRPRGLTRCPSAPAPTSRWWFHDPDGDPVTITIADPPTAPAPHPSVPDPRRRRRALHRRRPQGHRAVRRAPGLGLARRDRAGARDGAQHQPEIACSTARRQRPARRSSSATARATRTATRSRSARPTSPTARSRARAAACGSRPSRASWASRDST